MDRLKGKVAIVTGAGSGIGRAIAMAFAGEGAKVVVCDYRTDGMGEESVNLIKEAGGEAIYAAADVSKKEQIGGVVQTAVDTFGRLDILVNNAGVQRYKPLQDLTEADLDFMIAANQKGVFFGIQSAVPAMIASGGGSIINTASIAADHGQHGSLAYASTKGAILSMTRVAAAELAKHKIRVNAVQPGVVKSLMSADIHTKMPGKVKRVLEETPMNRMGTPEDCAGVYVFLASEAESGFITGVKVAVDGGILAEGHISV